MPPCKVLARIVSSHHELDVGHVSKVLLQVGCLWAISYESQPSVMGQPLHDSLQRRQVLLCSSSSPEMSQGASRVSQTGARVLA